jgi:hypothetical protein
MSNTKSAREPWLAMVVIAMGQALMSFNVAALPVSMGGMVESFGVPPTTIGTAIIMYSMGVSGFVLLGAKNAKDVCDCSRMEATSPIWRAMVLRGNGWVHIGVCGGIHSDPSRKIGSHGPKQKRQQFLSIFESQQHRQHDGESSNEKQFLSHEPHGSAMDLLPDFRDSTGAARLPWKNQKSREKANQSGKRNKIGQICTLR